MSPTQSTLSPVREDFYSRCLSFRDQLQNAHGFDEILKLWRSTSIPYAMPAIDPGSKAYRDEVLAIYERLTNHGYKASNELTSNKQSADDFRIGYPWVSKDFGVAAMELSKTVQALGVLQQHGTQVQSIVEFGCGWGNLAVPLAKLGRRVTAVDIDEAFLRRAQGLAQRDGAELDTYLGDFVEVACRLPARYDAAIFQSSFHHCLDFELLMARLADTVLTEEGRIFFFAEPIHRNYAFPWGLRYDGESLWAIMCNQWLELGFDEDFFLQMALRHGFFVRRVEGVPGFVGDGWMATRARHGLAFADVALPGSVSGSFWDRASDASYGRFLRHASELPMLAGQGRYRLQFQNFCPKPLRLRLLGDSGQEVAITVAAGVQLEVESPVCCAGPLRLECQTVVPDALIRNGDTREIGLALIRLAAV